jgi:uncharacterized membrane protein
MEELLGWLPEEEAIITRGSRETVWRGSQSGGLKGVLAHCFGLTTFGCRRLQRPIVWCIGLISSHLGLVLGVLMLVLIVLSMWRCWHTSDEMAQVLLAG